MSDLDLCLGRRETAIQELFFYLLEIIPLKTNFKGGGRKFTEFACYINDISTDIDSEIRLFADDCVCYREIKDTEDTLKLHQLGCWARKWGMRFLLVKCNKMQIKKKRIKKIYASYTVEGTVFENVESIKYLGVTITNDLRWNTHAEFSLTPDFEYFTPNFLSLT